MPVLKRILSTIGLRNKPDDDDDLPKVRRQSLLKRSNAVLKKKQEDVKSVDDNLSLKNFFHNPRDEARHRGPLPAPHALERQRSFEEFDDEMDAIARLRAGRRRHYPSHHHQVRGVMFDESWPLPAPRKLAPPRLQVDRSIAAQASSASLSIRYQDPLGAIAEGRFEGVRRRSSGLAFSNTVDNWHGLKLPQLIEDRFEEEEHWFRRWSAVPPAMDWDRPLRMAYERREAWVHKKKESEQSLENFELYADGAGAVESNLPSPSASPADSAFAMPDDAPGGSDVSHGKKRQVSHHEEIQAAVDKCLEMADRVDGERLSRVRRYIEELLVAQENSVSNGGLLIAEVEEQMELMLAASPEEPKSSSLQEGVASSSETRDCIVCGDTKPAPDFPAKPPTSVCEHTSQTCTSCLQSWMASEIDTKGTEGIKCPECPQTLSYADIQRAVSPSTFAIFENLATRAALGALTDFAWCLSPTCTSGQENHANANFMDCAACGYKQCLSHRMPWHTDETCKEYDYRTSGQKKRDEESKTEAMLDNVSKKCPNPKGCGWRIEKIDGCDHMTCRRCRWEFCWVCCASQKEIRRVGNTAHEVGCRYHSKNLEVAWPFNAH